MVVRPRALPFVSSETVIGRDPVPHEMENFASRARLQLCPDKPLARSYSRWRYAGHREAGSDGKSPEKEKEREGKNPGRFKYRAAPKSGGPPAFNNIYNERNPSTF